MKLVNLELKTALPLITRGFIVHNNCLHVKRLIKLLKMYYQTKVSYKLKLLVSAYKINDTIQIEQNVHNSGGPDAASTSRRDVP